MNKNSKNVLLIGAIYLGALLLAFGCATQSKSVGLGAAIGGGTGALIGHVADPGKNGEYRTRNVILGTTVGAMAGSIIGDVSYKEIESQKKEAFLKSKASAPQPSDGAMPNLKSPKVEAKWVEGKISGNRFVEGHYEYIIIEPARWEEN
ncbi:MAG TPA: hypothetical protein PLJ21_03475 [Pseudobdellovibrionaceae bacterium]|nr:hypothetical protein [Pseudobdellovibrionaceae bacterium]